MIGCIGYSLIAAIVYSASFYLKSGENFELSKFLATCVVGVMIGVMAFSVGIHVSEEFVITQMVVYAGAICLLETWIKLAIRWINKLIR